MKEAFSDFEIRWSYNSFISFDQLVLCIMRFEFCFFEIIGDLFINELLRYFGFVDEIIFGYNFLVVKKVLHTCKV